MTLRKKDYKAYDTLWLALEASPLCMLLYGMLPIVQSIMQTAVTAIATAGFVDTATAILASGRPYQDIYPALAVILVTLGFVNTLGAVARLMASRVSVALQRSLKPVIVKIHASFDYRHIEDEKSWELISRVYSVCPDPCVYSFGVCLDRIAGMVGGADDSCFFSSYVCAVHAGRKEKLPGGTGCGKVQQAHGVSWRSVDRARERGGTHLVWVSGCGGACVAGTV